MRKERPPGKGNFPSKRVRKTRRTRKRERKKPEEKPFFITIYPKIVKEVSRKENPKSSKRPKSGMGSREPKERGENYIWEGEGYFFSYPRGQKKRLLLWKKRKYHSKR